MAIILLGGGVTDIRGSIGGTTFARNAGGSYARNKTKPVNPRSTLQNKVRSVTAMFSKRWAETLTEVQRTGWRDYVAATVWTNRLGQVISISGMAAYVRTNVLLGVWNQAARDEPPSANGHAGSCIGNFTVNSVGRQITCTGITAPWDVNADDDHAIVSVGIAQGPGRLAMPKGFRNQVNLEGDSVAPLVFPLACGKMDRVNEGDRCTFRVIRLDPEFRVSTPTFSTCIAAPPA